ncbi:DnaJ-domain-containing protein [Amniculicola lignicola CBS 123094]|uniref:DnaJ-domain-containing protein n=1 Tax=Amniculicola lignicola CBS 123094 TaxID=1392246 RepID=A0A6A5WJC1_9PLEO|nr:DnaJ-domain-containing protein [Amniculicola lignicola CBS 123094]
MAPVPITEDYYQLLEVEQTATTEVIVSSYRRLALKLHPDRNTRADATATFQLLVRAYETLKDESQRKSYDLIYPSIARTRPSQSARPTPASKPQAEEVNEAAQIAAIHKSKRDRTAQWQAKKTIFDSSIFELQRNIRRLDQEIKNLDSILVAAAAEEARKKSWGTWVLSPLYKKVEETEEEKERKDRARQERRIEKDMKERRLEARKAELKKEQDLLTKAKEAVDAADLVDDKRLQAILAKIQARENQKREEKERTERERRWKEAQEAVEALRRQQAEVLRKQQAEALRKQQAEALRKEQAEALRKQQRKQQAEKKRQAKLRRQQEQNTYISPSERRIPRAEISSCIHDGWWPKEELPQACPECNEFWTYLLKCPGCSLKACPKCQANLRPKRKGRARPPPRVRTPSPDFGSYGYYEY